MQRKIRILSHDTQENINACLHCTMPECNDCLKTYRNKSSEELERISGNYVLYPAYDRKAMTVLGALGQDIYEDYVYGRTTKESSEHLGLSYFTINTYRRRLGLYRMDPAEMHWRRDMFCNRGEKVGV